MTRKQEKAMFANMNKPRKVSNRKTSSVSYKHKNIGNKSLVNKINMKRKPVAVGVTKGSSDGCNYYDLVVKYKDGGYESVDNYDSLSEARKDQETLHKEIIRKRSDDKKII